MSQWIERFVAPTLKSKTHGLGAFGAQRGAKRYLRHSEPARKKKGRERTKCFAPRKIAGRFFIPLKVAAFILAMTAAAPCEEPVVCESRAMGVDKFTPGVACGG
jgi:hypothetical protein